MSRAQTLIIRTYMMAAAVMVAMLFVPSIARAQDIYTGLVAHWTFDNDSGSTITDSSGNNNDGTWVDGGDNNISGEIVEGVNGNALRFAADTNIQASMFPAGASATYTVSIWLKPYGLASAGQLAIWRAGPDSPTCQNGPKLRKTFVASNYILEADNQCSGSPETSQYVYDGNWYNMVVVYDGTDLSLYQNGVLQESVASSYNGTDPQASAFRLGGTTSNTILADMDEFRLYNRALTAQDVKAIYDLQSGKIAYDFDARVPKYFNGTDWIAMGEVKYAPTGVYMNGVDSAVSEIPASISISDSAQGTISGWFKATSTDPVIFVKDNGGSPSVIYLSLDNANRISFFARDTTQNILVMRSSSSYDFLDGNWHHVVLSYDLTDPTQARSHMYVDGVADKNIVTWVTGQSVYLSDPTGDWAIAREGTTFYELSVADLWFDTETYVDLSVPGNLRKFIDGGDPVFLGASGELPTGSSPEFFFSGDLATWHTNKGTGGGFTENGELLPSGSRVDLSPPVVTLTNFDLVANAANYGGVVLNRHSVYVMGGVAAGEGLRIYDVSDPLNPALQHHLDDPAVNGTSFDISYPNIYFLSGNLLSTYDITDPSNPVLEGSGTITAPTPLRGFYAKDGFVYVAYSHGLHTFDVTDPNNPVTADILGPVTNCAGSCQALKDGYMYRAVDGPSLQVIDVRDPYNISLVLTQNTYTEASANTSPSIMGDKMILYGATGMAAYILDISNPASPTLINRAPIGNPNGRAYDTNFLVAQDGPGAFNEGSVYFLNGDDNLKKIYDIGAISAPAMMRSESFYNDRYVYGAPSCCGGNTTDLFVIDLASCTNPTRMAGSMIYNADSQVMQYCDGKDWQAMGPVPGDGSGGCSNPTRPEGSMIFNKDITVMQYCEGDEWIGIGKQHDCTGTYVSPSPGDICVDGSIYAGLSPDGNVPMYTTLADAPSTLTWNDGSANYIDTAMPNCGTGTSCQTGEANSLILVGLRGTGSPAPYAAAEYCDALSAHDKNDWYLPAVEELAVLFANKNRNNLNGTFNETGDNYWSSSEQNSDDARRKRFDSGGVSSLSKNTSAIVRCVRK